MNQSSELHIYSTIYLTYVLINFKVPENSHVWNWDLYFTPLPRQRDPPPVLTNSWMLSTCTWNSEIQEPLWRYIFPYFYTQCTVKWRYDYPSWIHVLLFIFVSYHDQSIPYSSQPPLTPISLSIPYLTCQGIMGESQRGLPATMDTKAVLRRSVSWWEKCDSRLPTRPGLPETFPLVALRVLCPGKTPSVLCKQLVTLHHNLCPLEQALPHIQETYIFN